MATVTQDLYIAGDPVNPDARVDMVFNDANGAISAINVVVNVGHLTVTIVNPPRPDIVRIFDAPTNTSFTVPNGYSLTQGPKGDWKWQGSLSASFQWTR